MEAQQLFEQGDLEGAIQAVTQEVKAHPTETPRRTFLFELLCFSGDLERANRQLDVIAHQDSQAEPAVQVYRNILHAEAARRRLDAGPVQPEFLLDPPPYARLHIEASARRGAQAKALLDESESMWPALRGRIDEQPFEEFRDCDDLIAPFLELIILRDYVWLPFDQIREIELAAPERPRDLLWAPARVSLITGAQHRGYVPVLYCDSHRHADNQVKLGRMTDWLTDDAGAVRGVGQRMFLAGDEAHPILATRHIEFEPAG